MRRIHTIAGLAALSLTMLLAGCHGKQEQVLVPRPVLVEHPQPMAGESGEVFPGTVRAREEADLSFRVPGKILTRRANAGQRVLAGAVLATLDAEDAKLNVQVSKSAVNAAEADVKLAQAEVQRYRELLDKGYISQSAFDLKQNMLNLTQAKLEQAHSSLAVVINQSNYANLVAPKAGLITAVSAEAGQVVAAGQPVFRFAAGSEREVQINVPEGRLDTVRKAERLSVTLWSHPGKLYPAKLREINLQADRSTRTHEARVTILQSDQEIELGTSASVVLGERLEQTMFVIPLSALGGTQEQPSVWIVEAGKLRAEPVKIVRYLENGAVVMGKLNAEMDMVSAGVHLLSPGQPVVPTPRERQARVLQSKMS